MSVVVKGMEMPENCLKCPMQFGGWCFVAPSEIDERVAPTVDEAAEQGRPKWCPLKPLSQKQELKKGWLKDGEEIMEAYINGYNACLDEITGETE